LLGIDPPCAQALLLERAANLTGSPKAFQTDPSASENAGQM
jgi:hypothetical protein